MQYSGTHSVHRLYFLNALAVWAVGNKSLLRTVDGGNTWTAGGEPTQAANCGSNPFACTYLKKVAFLTPTRGFGLGRYTLYGTQDGGLTWQPALPKGSAPVMDFCFPGAQDGWALATDAVLQTTNGGTSWSTSLKLPLGGGEGQGMVCTSSTDLWVTAAGDATMFQSPVLLYHTTNAGAHWTLAGENQDAKALGGEPRPTEQWTCPAGQRTPGADARILLSHTADRMEGRWRDDPEDQRRRAALDPPVLAVRPGPDGVHRFHQCYLRVRDRSNCLRTGPAAQL